MGLGSCAARSLQGFYVQLIASCLSELLKASELQEVEAQLALQAKATLPELLCACDSSCSSWNAVHMPGYAVHLQKSIAGLAGIKKCHVQEGTPFKVQTEGVNFPGVWQHADLADAAAAESNDIAAVFNVLGVEAARATLVRECSAVFGAYGIAVDARHLSLIADFMTHQVPKPRGRDYLSFYLEHDWLCSCNA